MRHPGFTSYERSSNGAVHPKRHVEGNNTQMSRSIHNLQVWEHPTDPRRDEVFVPKPLGSAILVFNRTDDGNVKPQRDRRPFATACIALRLPDPGFIDLSKSVISI